MNRRKFIELAAAMGACTSVSRLNGSVRMLAETGHADSFLTNEELSTGPATNFRPYCSRPVSSEKTPGWVQIDLGARYPIEMIRLLPSASPESEPWPYPYQPGTFPLRFKIEVADSSDFAVIADLTNADFPDPKNRLTAFPGNGRRARYIRITVTRMPAIPHRDSFAFVLSKVEVLSSGRDVALLAAVTADPITGNQNDLEQLTRKPRPQGEGVITDHPENVIPAANWKPAQYRAQAPLSGVVLNGGLFEKVMENNIGYLLRSFTVDDLLRQFRERAGKPLPLDSRTPHKFWEEDLAGSNAGRFLMGAGNTLRWIDHPILRKRLDEVVNGIEDCRQANGYIMAYPEDTIFYSERGAYTRAWLTHGLIEAGYAGNSKAFNLLRGNYDWFNQCPYLPQLLRRAGFGPQGMVPNTRLYFTPVGKPEDIQVIQRYFQENYWMQDLSQEEEEAIWQYPYDRPHCYEVTFFEAYLDLYRATGDQRYLKAMLGAWKLYHENWENVGGSTALEEMEVDPPKSYRLDDRHGEFCGTTFWVFFNQRFHLLMPEEEKYVAEIEKSIYNIAIANQAGTEGIRYFAVLVGSKLEPNRRNTCCEGQGTRLLGALPEFIYSIAQDGFYVNLFEPSTLEWKGNQGSLQMKMETRFPAAPEVRLRIATSSPTSCKIRVRVPGWASHDMEVCVNGQKAIAGKPGFYVTLDREWSNADEIRFTLPLKFKMTRYEGESMDNNFVPLDRYALEYGPILLAAVGRITNERHEDATIRVTKGPLPEDMLGQLVADPQNPLHFWIEGNDQVRLIPYWEVKEEPFTCFPTLSWS
jgi:DUF1680 family protein